MGEIEKQSIKGTIYTYIGVLIGFINTALIFPKIFHIEQIGLLNILISYSLVFAQISSLGFNNTAIKLFPYFRNEDKKNNGFLFIYLLTALVGFLLVLVVFLFIYPYIVNNPNDSSVLLSKYGFYIIPLAFFTLYFNSLDVFSRVLYKSLVGIFLKEFLVRILVLVDILMFYFNIITFENFVLLYIVIYSLPAFVIAVQLIKEGKFNVKPQLRFLDKELISAMISVSLFGIIGGFAGVAVVNIDKIMINQMLGLGNTGIYSIAFYFGALIVIPSRPLIRITSAYISDSWKNNDIRTIDSIYRKSVINQTVIGLLLIIGILGNINNIFELLPKEYSKGYYVLVFISFSFLLDMLIGVSTNIIGSSKYYKMQSYFTLLLIVILFFSNIVFIPKYGIAGAAFASLLSKFIINGLKVLFIYLKFKLFPFNGKIIISFLIAMCCYFLSRLLPDIGNLIVDIFIRSSMITIVFISLIYIFKVSDEVNNKISEFYKLISKII